jgi:hypothetical protein
LYPLYRFCMHYTYFVSTLQILYAIYKFSIHFTDFVQTYNEA